MSLFIKWFIKDGNVVVGTDTNMIESFSMDEGKANGIVTRFTGFPTQVYVSKNKDYIVAASR